MTEHPSVPFDELLARQREIRSFVRHLARDADDADDLEQEGWLRALERPPRDASNPVGWFGRVVRRLRVDRARSDQRREARESARDVDRTPPPTDDLVARLELDQRVGRAVMELDEPYREVVLLRFWEGASLPEIAARTGRPLETVRTRLRRAQDRLRERLDHTYGERATWAALAGVPKSGLVAGAAGGLTGILAMKKLAAAAALVAVALVAHRVVRSTPEQARTSVEPEVEAAAAPLERAETEVATSTTQRTEPEAERVALAEPTSSVAATCVARGRVVDESGAVVVGARVLLSSWGVWSAEHELPAHPTNERLQAVETRSGADGRFRFDLPGPPTASCYLELVPDAHAERRSIEFRRAEWDEVPEWARDRELLPALTAGEHDLGELVLRHAGALRVRVVDEEGRPLEGAGVRLCAQAGDWRTLDSEVPAAADGFVTIGHVLPGETGLCLEHPDHLHAFSGPHEVLAGRTLEVGDVTLVASPRITGFVVTEGGAPAPEAWIFGSPYGGGRILRIETDDQGRFEVPLAQDTPYSLKAVREDDLASPSGESSGPFPPGSTEVRLVLPSRDRREVLVLDAASGDPVDLYHLEEFRTNWMPKELGGRWLERSYLQQYSHRMPGAQYPSRPEGRTVLEGSGPDRAIAVTAPTFQRALVEVDEGEGTIVVELVPDRVLRGRVVLEGRPVEGASVRAVLRGLEKMFAPKLEASSDVDGAFVLPGLTDGTYLVRVRAADGLQWEKEVEVSADLDLGDVVLTQGAVVSGRLLVPDGRDPAELMITLHPRGGPMLGGAPHKLGVAPDGTFRFDGLAPGEYALRIDPTLPNSKAWAQLPIETVVARAGAPLDLQLDLRASGTAPATIAVTLADGPATGPGLSLYARTDAGLFEVGRVHEGVVRGFLPAPAVVTAFELAANGRSARVSTGPTPTLLDEAVELEVVFGLRRFHVPLELPDVELADVRLQVACVGSGGANYGTRGLQYLLPMSDFGGWEHDLRSGELGTPPLPLGTFEVTVTVQLEGEAEAVATRRYRVHSTADATEVETLD